MPPRNIALLSFGTLALIGLTGFAAAQQLRYHTANAAKPVTLIAATQTIRGNSVRFRVDRTKRVVEANSLPNHAVGLFPNPGNPNAIAAQEVSLSMPLTPVKSITPSSVQGWLFGISSAGVAFDPFAGEFWHGDRRSGWNYDALGGAVSLGLDANHAHVQPGGAYHYHGVPTGLLEVEGYTPNAHSPLLGYAADGYPIYALTGVVDGKVTAMTSSYRLRDGKRPGGNAPGGAYDGAFVEDWEYVPGSGTLDACNGAFTVSADYPEGTYAYFLTESFPGVPRCFSGVPDQSFNKRIGQNAGPPAQRASMGQGRRAQGGEQRPPRIRP